MNKEERKDQGRTPTEERILEAAREQFLKKGYAATKTRDIATLAGINLALMNYYFRSKENLFGIIMAEKTNELFAGVLPALRDTETSLEEKLIRLSEHYTDMLLRSPQLAIFVLTEIHKNPERFGRQIIFHNAVMQSEYIRQLAEADPNTEPVSHLITYLGILIFPFLMKPVIHSASGIDDEHFTSSVLTHKRLAPVWMKSVIGI